MIRHDWTRNLVRVGFALGLLALAAGPAAADRDESYGYFRAIDGSATLIQAGSGTRTPAEINQPVMAGDRILSPGSSRVEIVLPDRNILRLDGDTEVTLEQLAASPDRDDPTTVLRLHDGNILLTVIADSLGDQLPRVDTPNASVYPQAYGTYRITSSQDRFTEVTVRRGKAEVATERGSEVVRADETGIVDGIAGGNDRYAEIEVESAASYDNLERWASRLEDEARYASANDDYLDDDLRYQAAPLARYGAWISVGGRNYWRPRVSVGWQPYSQGRWAYTPAGLTWVSYEPWGWVPYHYGSWDYLPSYGWVWQAGRTWAPAWVYWYWGPSYVGWCPTGYYTSYYRGSYSYFRHGVYGWAGGSWDHWNHWTFVNTSYFRGYRDGYRNGYWDGRRDGRRDDWNVGRYAVPIDELRRHGPLDRGVVTTDTRPLRPDTWDDPRHAIRVLTESPGGRPRYNEAGGKPGELPDVTPFIERRRDLPAGVVRTVTADNGGDQTGGARPRPGTRDDGGTVGRGSEPRGGISVIPTDPSTERRAGTRERPRAGGDTPSTGGGAPRGDRGSEPGVQPGGRIRGGAPRPEAGGGGGVESTAPRVRVPREGGASGNGGGNGGSTGSGSTGSDTRTRTREGGAPRPQSTESESPSSRERTRDQGGRGGYTRPEAPQSYSPPPSSSRERGREQQDAGRGGYSRPEPPRSSSPPPSSSSRERDRGQGGSSGSRGGYSRPEPPASSSPPPSSSRERERERYSPPPSSSRPESSSPSPSYRERERSRPSEGSSSRGSSRGSSSGSSGRQSRERRPPQG